MEASTKSGKTVAAIAWIVEKAFQYKPGQNAWWVAPVSQQADIAYRRIKNFLTPGSFNAFASPWPRIELISGGIIWIKSSDNSDSLYGEDVYDVVLDEASRAKPETWPAIRSTLSATRGNARLIGNVKGRANFFYHLSRQAEKGDLPGWHYAKITYRDAIDAGVLDPSDIDDARRTMSERDFQELYEATAADNIGNPFGAAHIDACIKPLSLKKPAAFGIDLAKEQDWFVIIGLDEDGSVCSFDRWQHIPWRESIARVHSIVGEDTPALVDSTGVGDPVVEEIQREHGNFLGYNFSARSKQRLMEGLAVSIQSHEISYPDGVIPLELHQFEYVYLPSGVRYAAGTGYSDDCVVSLALAREQLSTLGPGQNLMKFYSESVKENKPDETPVLLDKTGIDNPRPWKSPSQTSSDVLDNELTELYRETLTKNGPSSSRICASCGHPVLGPTRKSDGFFIWHPECPEVVNLRLDHAA